MNNIKKNSKEKNKEDNKEENQKEKTYYFVAGMPRSGSTLLCNILAQNPRFHTTGTSGIMDIMFGVRNSWDNLIEFKASPNEPAKIRVLRAILHSYYSDISKPVIFDKCRGWLSLLEMAETILGHKAKVLVPVRDIRDVLSSFEKLWRANNNTMQPQAEAQNYFEFQSVEGRVRTWLRADQPVGLAYARIIDALKRGFGDRMLFVDFDGLTANPKETMKKIYEFLGEEYYDHDFNNVEQVTWENDEVHGMKGLHDIRQKVKPVVSNRKEILGDFVEELGRLNFWKENK